MNKNIFIGGLIAAGFDKSGSYMLTVSHSGRGVFVIDTWERVARDEELAYPENGEAIGIGPIVGEVIKVVEEYAGNSLILITPNGLQKLIYNEGVIIITENIN